MKNKLMTTATLLGTLALSAHAYADQDDRNLQNAEAVAQQVADAIANARADVVGGDSIIFAGDLPVEIQQLIEQFEQQGGGALPPEMIQTILQLAEDQPGGIALPAFPDAVAIELIDAAFLGVNAHPVAAGVEAIEGVTPGSGLRVAFVAEDSPASAAGVRVGDVLTHLGDQMLINAEQLAVLVRMHAEGDTVTLHVLREGQAIELQPELAIREVTPLAPGGGNLSSQWRFQNNPGAIRLSDARGDIARLEAIQEQLQRQLNEFDPLAGDPDARQRFDELVQQMQRNTEQHREAAQQMLDQLHAELGLDLDEIRGDDERDVARSFSQVTMNDDEHTLTLRSDGTTRNLNIRNADGELVYDGEVKEDGQIDGLPEALQDKVDRFLQNTNVQIRVQGAE